MHISESTITAAFQQYAVSYEDARLWNTPYHAICWAQAQEAFEGGSAPAFDWLYDQLRSRWQVFRSRNWDAPSAARVKQVLDALPIAMRCRSLTELVEGGTELLVQVWNALTAASSLKMNSDGPSLVAVSKFLHFWNPRLFVIADREFIWQWVFRHRWLWVQVERVKQTLSTSLPAAVLQDPLHATKLGDYLAMLVWGGEVLHENPTVTVAFAEYVNASCSEPVRVPLADYQAAALEWLLLGLVELPAAGVTVRWP
jgi:hypothetical protein